eukprot:NODE_1585_length_904_cov_99.050292_g1235_i0.p1 GENE.NODE_1585_length_904_cov_99.050292_g1235_i0~~NODE_1585_length_904_cov_99.050292_g1235_i0.p1  ORF type:complete len:222 (-),score=40.70 NODE_1585_length_904_cov_99.050292_g1235_i0:172-837(-)
MLVLSPVATTALTAALSGFYGFGIDALTQHTERMVAKKKRRAIKASPEPSEDLELIPEFDFQRSLRFGKVAFLWVGPWMHIRFQILDMLIAGSGPQAALYKMLINLYLMGPVTTSVGVGLNEWFKPGHTLADVKHRLQTQFWKIQMAKWMSRPLSLFLIMLCPTVWEKQIAAWVLDAAVVMYVNYSVNCKIPAEEDIVQISDGAAPLPDTPFMITTPSPNS